MNYVFLRSIIRRIYCERMEFPMRLDKNFIKKIISEVKFLGSEWPENPIFSLDSRTVQPGNIFIALPGMKVDGHTFMADAFARGAAGAIISSDKQSLIELLDKKFKNEKAFMIVSDPKDALIKIAAAWRALFTCPVIGVTGSVGKTVTKEMLANILKANGTPHLISEGNQNTLIGTSINILRLREHHQVVVMEMGVSKRGEMARMAEVIKPTSAIITYLGHCHMEGLGSIHDIANEKRDIFKYFKEDNIGIVYGDQPILAQVAYTHPTIKFGCKTTNQIQARKIQSTNERTSFILKLYKDRFKVMMKTSHEGRVLNALAAASAAHFLGFSPEVIVEGIQAPINVRSRFEPRPLKNNKGIIIDDAYNANPESMKAALLALERVDSKGAKIAVLGDMLELGVNSPFWHRQLGRFLRKVPSLDHVVLVGDHVKWTQGTVPAGLKVDIVKNWNEALSKVNAILEPDSVVLVKGSLGVQLTHLVEEMSASEG